MRIPSKILFLSLLAVVCAASVGAKGLFSQGEYGIRQQNNNFTDAADQGEFVAGINEASMMRVTMLAGPSEGVPLMIWTDSANGSSANGGGGPAEGAYFKTQPRLTSGRRFLVEATTTDGKTATMTIAGKPYDLAKGRLFLISLQGEQPRVAQLQMDINKIPMKVKAVSKFAHANKEIRDFWLARDKPGNQAASN